MIKTIKDLEDLLVLIRKQGVFEFKMGDLEMRLQDMQVDLPITEALPEEPVQYPSQEELDRAVNLPVGDIDDPFVTYNEM